MNISRHESHGSWIIFLGLVDTLGFMDSVRDMQHVFGSQHYPFTKTNWHQAPLLAFDKLLTINVAHMAQSTWTLSQCKA